MLSIVNFVCTMKPFFYKIHLDAKLLKKYFKKTVT